MLAVPQAQAKRLPPVHTVPRSPGVFPQPEVDETILHLPASTIGWKYRLARHLHEELHIPGFILAFVFQVSNLLVHSSILLKLLKAPSWHLHRGSLTPYEPKVELVLQVKSSVWIGLIAWICMAPFAARSGVGELYVLGTIAALIFCNLGTRKEGEASAYSVFNNFERLPGQLTADELDRQVRTGQM